MIERYTLPEFKELWSDQNKFQTQWKVEFKALEAMEKYGDISAGVCDRIKSSEHFGKLLDVKRIYELEETTKHETAAFVAYLEELYGDDAKWFHYGLTSSDILDTAQSMTMLRAIDIILHEVYRAQEVLLELSRAHAKTPMIGRSHGMHAEPTTFGFVMAGHAMEMSRCIQRLYLAKYQLSVGKLSGPVGNYTNVSQDVERFALASLGLVSESIATQVVARDRYADVFATLGLVATCIERLVTTLRHLQRSEVGEVAEGFANKQKGSSAMPHKKNPILSENITGIARMVRSMVLPAMEDVVLWHERDMSHSSVERHICPDATSLVGYMANRLTTILKNLVVKPERMLENINSTYGVWASQSILLSLIWQGLSRSQAYEIVQRNSFECSNKKIEFKAQLLTDPEVTDKLSVSQIESCCDLEPILEKCKARIDKIFGNE